MGTSIAAGNGAAVADGFEVFAAISFNEVGTGFKAGMGTGTEDFEVITAASVGFDTLVAVSFEADATAGFNFFNVKVAVCFDVDSAAGFESRTGAVIECFEVAAAAASVGFATLAAVTFEVDVTANFDFFTVIAVIPPA